MRLKGVARPPKFDTTEQGEWPERARCRGEDSEKWFAADSSEAKEVCRSCPVAADCLGWALANGQDYGVWGGMDEDERRKLKKAGRRGQQ